MCEGELLVNLRKELEDALARDTGDLEIDRFLAVHYGNQQRVLLRASEQRLCDIFLLFLCAADKVMKTQTKEWRPTHARAICAYLLLCKQCCEACCAAGALKEALNESCAIQAVGTSLIVFQTDFGTHSDRIRATWQAVLGAAASVSSLLYDKFGGKLREVLTANNAKAIMAIQKSWVGLSTSVEQVLPALLPIARDLGRFQKGARQQFCDAFTTILVTAMKRSPNDFIGFIETGKDMEDAQIVFDEMNEWKEKDSRYAWPAQMMLLLLLPSKYEVNKELPLVKKLRGLAEMKSAKREFAINALLVGWKAMVLSYGNEKLTGFMVQFYEQFLNYFLTPKVQLTNPSGYVDFALCSLLLNVSQFEQKILPVLLNEKANLYQYVVKAIVTLAKLSSVVPNGDLKYFRPLVKPCVELLTKTGKGFETFPRKIVKAFKLYPPFFRLIVAENDAFVTQVFANIWEKEEVMVQEALIAAYDPKYVEASIPRFWKHQHDILTLISDMTAKKGLYSVSKHGAGLHRVAVQIAEFLLVYFQSLTSLDPGFVHEGFKSLTLLETLGIMFLATDDKNMKSAGITILSSLLEIVHTSDEFSQFPFPTDEYQSLIMEARRSPSVLNTQSNTTIMNTFRELKTPNAGVHGAGQALYPYFLALTHAISPDVPIGNTKVEATISLANEELTSEWASVGSIVYALEMNESIAQPLYDLGVNALEDRALGDWARGVIGRSLNIKSMMRFLTLLTERVASHKPDEMLSTDNICSKFIENSLIVVAGLLKMEKYWTADRIDTDVFCKLITSLMAFCDIVPDINYRKQCVLSIIGVNEIITANGKKPFDPCVRHKIGKTILNWITSDSEIPRDVATAMHKALALVIDNLALINCKDQTDPRSPEDQAKEKFMLYLATIKSKLDASVNSDATQDIVNVLAALLKENLTIGIEECISMGFAEKPFVRAAFISAVSQVFKVPETKEVEADVGEKTVIDLLFDEGFDLIEFVSGLVPYSRAEAFGAAAVQGAVLKGIEMDFLGCMMDIEIRTVDQNSKNTLFRGNAVPARAVGYYPRIVGTKWMTDTLRPIFEEVLKNCEKGMRYGVDPERLGAGEDIDANRANFRELLEKTVKTIADARESMPPTLVREAQILYQKVYEKYGDFASQIMSGFLFLRFLLPAFNIPNLVGLPAVLPDPARQALTAVSVFMMVVTVKRTLEDKGKHLSDYFDDIASRSYDIFVDMFAKIATADVGDAKDEIVIDEADVISKIHAELHPILQQIKDKRDEQEESSPLRKQLDRLIQKLESVEPSQSQKKKHGPAMAEKEKKSSSKLDAIVNMQFPADALQKVNGFMVRGTEPAPDGSAIYFLDFSKLKDVTEPIIVTHIMLKTLKQESAPSVILVYLLRSFDDTKIPNPSQIKKYMDMSPVQKVKKSVCFEVNETFVQFAQRNMQLFEKANHFCTVKDIPELTSLLGHISGQIPVTSYETVTVPSSVQSVTVDGHVKQVRIHQNSVQFVGEKVSGKSFELQAITVVMNVNISNILAKDRQADESPTDYRLITTDGMKYHIIQPESSSLYNTLVSTMRTSKALHGLTSRVKVNTETLKWLMLNVAFTNMVSDHLQNSLIRKASLDLVTAVLSSFNLEHKMVVAKVPVQTLPDNLLGFVKDLSEDLADCNPDCFAGFMMEFFKVYGYVEKKCRSTTFDYLRPWIRYWAANITDHKDLFDVILEKFHEMEEKAVFATDVWEEMARITEARDFTMQKIYSGKTDKDIEIVTSMASVDQTGVTKFWIDHFVECSEKNSEYMTFVSRVLTRLLSVRLFSYEYMAPLIYGLVRMRFIYSDNVLTSCMPLFVNVFHTLFYTCDVAPGISTFSAICEDFCKKWDMEQYLKDELWFDRCAAMASAFRMATNDEALIKDLYQRFRKDIEDSNKGRSAAALIFASRFALGNEREFARKIIQMLLTDRTPSFINPACAALSVLTMDAPLAVELLFVAIVTLLRAPNRKSVDLIITTLKVMGEKSMTDYLTPQSTRYLNTATGLDFNKACVNSVLIVLTLYAKESDLLALKDYLIASKEPVGKLFSLIFKEQNLSEVKCTTFHECPSTIGAVVLLLLRTMPCKALVEYAIWLCSNNPDIFSGCGFLTKSENSLRILKEVKSPTLIAMLAAISVKETTKTGKCTIAPILEPAFNHSHQPVTVDDEQYERLLKSLANTTP